MIIIIVYMTTGDSNMVIEENRKKYNEIRKFIQQHRETETIIMGDMNGHIGILGEKINENGKLLLTFTEENDLEIGNLTKAIGKVTWQRKGGTERSAIDYLLFNNKLAGKIKIIKVDEEKIFDLNSDHNMITVEIRNQERKNNKIIQKQIRKWKRKNVDWKKYREELEKLGQIRGSTKEEILINLQKTMRSAGEKGVGYTTGIRRSNYKSWWNNEIKQKRRERKEANRKKRKIENERRSLKPEEITKEMNNEWNLVCREYMRRKMDTHTTINKAMQNEEERKLEEIRKKKSNREWWLYLKEDENKEEDKEIDLKINGEITNDQGKIENFIKNYWEELGKKDNIELRNQPIKMTCKQLKSEQNYKIDKIDIHMHLQKLMNMKTAGPDEIPNEFYKEGGEKIETALETLFEKIDEDEQVPLEWNTVKGKLVFKGGKRDKKEIKNYRPIAVANSISNIYCGILKDKLTKVIEEDEILSEEQNGFRKNRRGIDNVYVINELIEETNRKTKNCIIHF